MRKNFRQAATLGFAVSAASAFALSAGSAHALGTPLTCTFINISNCDGTIGNLVFSGFTLNSFLPGLDPDDTITISEFIANRYTVQGGYAAGLNGPLSGSGSFSFTATPAPGFKLLSASADSDTIGSTFVFTNTLSNLPASPLVSIGGNAAGPENFTSGSPASNVVVAWAANGDLALSSTLNISVESDTPVPGPLPLLGAAAAFSASRRLRRRVNAAGL